MPDARAPFSIWLRCIGRREDSDALPLYEQALQIYTQLYGQESTELADSLDREAELYNSLNDYPTPKTYW
jgi:hypothetical protein